MTGLGIEPDVYYDPSGDKGNGEWVACFEERPYVIRNLRRKSKADAWAAMVVAQSPPGQPKPSNQMNLDRLTKQVAAHMAKAARRATEEVNE